MNERNRRVENKRLRTLTIFRIRKGVSQPELIVKEDETNKSFELSITGCNFAKLYTKRIAPKTPDWAELFLDLVDANNLGTNSSVSAILLVGVGDYTFVLTFGHGRHLVRDDTLEERFGLVCTLNSVAPDSLRCVDVQSLDAIQSHSRIQSGLEIPVGQFGLNVEQDMLKAVVGAPKDSGLGARMTGGDSLSVSVRMNLSDLPSLLRAYEEQFTRGLSATVYAWVNNINLVKRSSALIDDLNSIVVSKFRAEDYQDIWLAIPEIIDWNKVSGFTYQGSGKAMHSDINLDGFLSTLSETSKVTVELLKTRKVFCVDEDYNRTGKAWSIYKCLYAEIEKSDQKYIFNGGLWYRVDEDFVAQTNGDFSNIPMSTIALPSYHGGGEGHYNRSVAESMAKKYDLLDDKKKVFHGGGYGQVEICDLFSKNRELIHVKRYGKSNVLSHLFSQGFVSGQLLQMDKEFRRKVVDKLSHEFKDLIDVDVRPIDKQFTIVFAIISELQSHELHLPFFSRVNLNNTFKQLIGFGYRVELLKIDVDQTYAVTKKYPPEKNKKL